MTQINLPFRPLPGELEDVSQLMADFDAILNVVNGQLGNDNFGDTSPLSVDKIQGGLPGSTLITGADGIPAWQPAGGEASGVIKAYGGDVAPAGYLVCDGAAIQRANFATLFTAIGTRYGPGDGVNTFNVPNLKGRIPAGLDVTQGEFNNLGAAGGHKLLQKHGHVVNSHSHGGGVTGGNADIGIAPDGHHSHMSYLSYDYITNGALGGAGNNRVTGVQADWGRAIDHQGGTSADGTHGHGIYQNPHGHGINAEAPGTNDAGDGSAQNLQPYLVVTFIIKT